MMKLRHSIWICDLASILPLAEPRLPYDLNIRGFKAVTLGHRTNFEDQILRQSLVARQATLSCIGGGTFSQSPSYSWSPS